MMLRPTRATHSARGGSTGGPAGVPWSLAMAERWREVLGGHSQSAGMLEKLGRSLAESTAASYGHHWQRFVRWCEDEPDQPCPLPAATATVMRWVEDLTRGGRVKESSLQPYLSGLNKVHEDLDFELPATGTLLRSYRKGLARTQLSHGRETERTYLPPPVVERAMLWALARAQRGLRMSQSDRAHLRACVCVTFTFVFFARGGTGSQLLSSHVRRGANGITITLEHEKGRATAKRARAIVIPTGAIPGLEDLLALWERVRGEVPPSAPYYWLPSDGAGALPSTFVDAQVKLVLALLRVTPPAGETWSGHSLRKGAASGAAARGVGLDRICYVGGWSVHGKAVHLYVDPTCPDSPACRRFFGWLRPTT